MSTAADPMPLWIPGNRSHTPSLSARRTSVASVNYGTGVN
jgi:hypothetical protein